MNINLFLMSFSYLYAEYTYYCYEVPNDKPVRYYDGNKWRIMLQTSKNKTSERKRRNCSIDLDWSDFESIDNRLNKVLHLNLLKSSIDPEHSNSYPESNTTKYETVVTNITTVTTKKENITDTKKKSSIKTVKKSVTKARRTVDCQTSCGRKKATTRKKKSRFIKKTRSNIVIKPNFRAVENPRKITKKMTRTTKSNMGIENKNIKPPKKNTKNKKRTTKSNKKTTKKNTKVTKKRVAIATTKLPITKITGAAAIPEKLIDVMKYLVNALKAVEKNHEHKADCCDTVHPKRRLYISRNPFINGRKSLTGLEDIASILADGVEIDRSLEDKYKYEFNNARKYTNGPNLNENYNILPDNHVLDSVLKAMRPMLIAEQKMTIPRKGKYYTKIKNEELDLHIDKAKLALNDLIALKDKDITVDIEDLDNFEYLSKKYESQNKDAVSNLDNTEIVDESSIRHDSQGKDLSLDVNASKFEKDTNSKEDIKNNEDKLQMKTLKTNYEENDSDNSQDITLDLEAAFATDEIEYKQKSDDLTKYKGTGEEVEEEAEEEAEEEVEEDFQSKTDESAIDHSDAAKDDNAKEDKETRKYEKKKNESMNDDTKSKDSTENKKTKENDSVEYKETLEDSEDFVNFKFALDDKSGGDNEVTTLENRNGSIV